MGMLETRLDIQSTEEFTMKEILMDEDRRSVQFSLAFADYRGYSLF